MFVTKKKSVTSRTCADFCRSSRKLPQKPIQLHVVWLVGHRFWLILLASKAVLACWPNLNFFLFHIPSIENGMYFAELHSWESAYDIRISNFSYSTADFVSTCQIPILWYANGFWVKNSYPITSPSQLITPFFSLVNPSGRRGKIIENLFDTQRQIKYLFKILFLKFYRICSFQFEIWRKILESKSILNWLYEFHNPFALKSSLYNDKQLIWPHIRKQKVLRELWEEIWECWELSLFKRCVPKRILTAVLHVHVLN